jgi:hypothetical protein
MADRITLEGTGVDYEVYEISEEVYGDLLRSGCSQIDRDELEIPDNSSGLVIDGFTSSICVNEEHVIALGRKGDDSSPNSEAFTGFEPRYDFCFETTLGKENIHSLIYCQISRGTWGFVDISEPFDPSKLDLKAERIRISSQDPDWEDVIDASSSTYDGVEFEFDSTSPRSVRWFLVAPSGEYQELE